jgi:hypothetical protein
MEVHDVSAHPEVDPAVRTGSWRRSRRRARVRGRRLVEARRGQRPLDPEQRGLVERLRVDHELPALLLNELKKQQRTLEVQRQEYEQEIAALTTRLAQLEARVDAPGEGN